MREGERVNLVTEYRICKGMSMGLHDLSAELQGAYYDCIDQYLVYGVSTYINVSYDYADYWETKID